MRSRNEWNEVYFVCVNAFRRRRQWSSSLCAVMGALCIPRSLAECWYCVLWLRIPGLFLNLAQGWMEEIIRESSQHTYCNQNIHSNGAFSLMLDVCNLLTALIFVVCMMCVCFFFFHFHIPQLHTHNRMNCNLQHLFSAIFALRGLLGNTQCIQCVFGCICH